jgi:hypothetical protein
VPLSDLRRHRSANEGYAAGASSGIVQGLLFWKSSPAGESKTQIDLVGNLVVQTYPTYIR